MYENMTDDEKKLRQIDSEWNKAYPNCDIETLDLIIADDWKCIDGAGRIISKQQLLERIAANPDPPDSYQFYEFDLRLFGNTAIVTGRVSGKGKNESGNFSFDQRYTRVYVKRGERGFAVATQVTAVSHF